MDRTGDHPAGGAPGAAVIGTGPPLTAEQQEALQQILQAVQSRSSCALVGPAGSGKTTLLRALLARVGVDHCLTVSPTHKALRLLGQALPDVRGCTVASLLRLRPGICAETGRLQFRRGAADPQGAAILRQFDAPPRLIVLDESSMVSQIHISDLAGLAKSLGAAIVFTGDRAQLPPVSSDRRSTSMGREFIANPNTAVLSTVMRQALDSPILALATRIRTASRVIDAWPARSSSGPAGSVYLHPTESTWLDAAVSALQSPGAADDVDAARVLCWSHRKAAACSTAIRERLYGSAAQQWQVGEWLSAVNGLGPEGDALGIPLQPATSECRIVAVGAVEQLQRNTGSFVWRTPAKQLPRETQLEATTMASRVTVEFIDGSRHQVWLEPPGLTGDWGQQVRDLRNQIRRRCADATDAVRRELFAAAADLDSWCPTLRPAMSQTIHSSQGSSYGSVFLASDVRFALDTPEGKALIYVGCSRARRAVHLLPLWGGAK